jgi:hypothetical protein
MKPNDRVTQGLGCAPPPQVAELWAKTTLSRFGVAQSSAAPGRSLDPAPQTRAR